MGSKKAIEPLLGGALSPETFRAREVYRYYQPKHLAEPSNPSSLSNSDQKAIPVPAKSSNRDILGSFSDTALTAFAQLIAIRLAAQRAVVSLIDHENEYFLAESTSTLSHLTDDDPTKNAWLSISGVAVPRSESLCEQTLCLVPNEDTTAEMTPVFFVPDLRLDPKMSQMDCVKGPPHLRFYCGVPLTNKKGVNIGCVYVVDDRPRTGFNLEQAQFLSTMAATVMDHLENNRAKEDVVMVTRMSQALHAFIEGDGTMGGDWERLKRYNLPAGAGVGFHWESNKRDENGVQVKAMKGLRGTDSSTPSRSESGASTGQSPLQHTTNSQDARFNFNNSPWSSSSEVPQTPALHSVFEGIDEPVDAQDGGRDGQFSNDGFWNLLHGTFARASNLVREGMEVDGAVFFDAPFRFYQGRSTLEPDNRPLGTGETESSTESDDEGHVEARPGPRPYVINNHHHHTAERKTAAEVAAATGLKSDILGFSTGDSSSWNNQLTKLADSFSAIDQSLLTSLVRRYPKGALFVFDDNGPNFPPDSYSPDGSQATIISAEVVEKRARREGRKRVELRRLLAAFPGSRQIFFVPLYDSTSGCFIGSFAWSTSATRIFSIENHLSYLVAFGHSVMAEVSRLNTLSADHAKGDFISNVSHELRSPLHGILASVEFLADTKLDGFQRNLVETVDICGRTLLDTIEHVLDFSKIKKFGQDSKQPLGVASDLDISAVIEEVLEGIFAGFEFNGLSSQGLADMTKSQTRGLASARGAQRIQLSNQLRPGNSTDLLTVVLDMDFREVWKFPTVPGTWRRLTMNIFGNALKYTPTGFIKIRLEARDITPPHSIIEGKSIGRTMVTLTITDSGQGMSSDFMKTGLFMPFSQENPTAPGTGLGMSIVKQIVDLSGGSIDIRSELGKGTEVKLSLPLEDCITDPENPNTLKLSDPQEDHISAVRRRGRGRTVTIRGFDVAFEDSPLQLGALASLKASIEKYVTEWFGFKLSSTDEDPDILICDESAFQPSSVSQVKFRALLILCSNGARRDIYTSQLDGDQTIEFISKPCGPHRLSKALLNSFDAEDAMQTTSKSRVSETGPHSILSSNSSNQTTILSTDAGRSSRLIGNIQSSIGFSPTTNLNRPPSPVSSRLPFLHRTLEADSLRIESEKHPASEFVNPSPESFDTSSSSQTPNSSASQLESDPNTPIRKGDLVLPAPKVLLVEDNPINMMLLETYMKKNKWELEKAVNGLIAVEAFQRDPLGFDVVFMDVSMPVMNGYEATRLIRSTEAERRVAYDQQQQIQSPLLCPPSNSFPFYLPSTSNPASPSSFASIDLHLHTPKLQLNAPALIVALTGFSSRKDQELAFEAGVDIFMTKPVRFREVGKILDGWLETRRKDSNSKAVLVGS
ncbi:hypothetical protein G7Y89_g6476 [Cudoniella acicularis]|uniref:histidine kinase n=1 Tax=Cudoniella acicularis TaxID=354080 RepID=A0A8H4RLV2_9HELO|nr:hypothetical protein G7Y89_g6476 [Cudoniella acicularis]